MSWKSATLHSKTNSRFATIGMAHRRNCAPLNFGMLTTTGRAIYIQIICGVPGVGRPVDTINLPDEGAASITFAQALGKSVKLTQMARECTKDITGLEPQDVTVLPPGVNWAVLCYQDDYTFLIDGTTCNPEGKLYGCQGLIGICLQFRFWIMDAKIILRYARP